VTGVERRHIVPGLGLSRMITGLWQIADMERGGQSVDLDATARAMSAYVDAGFTTFDMADHYGSAEDVVGRFVQLNGSTGVELLTKWVPRPGRLTAADVRRAVQRSLSRMRLEQLPLLQFHAWSYADPSWLDALFWLDELRREGLIGHLGVTNFDTAHLRIALTSGIPIVTNQVCFSLLDQRAAGAMTRLCEEHGVRLLAFGSVAGGLLSERWLGVDEPAEMDTWSAMKYRRFVNEAGGWSALQRLLGVLQHHATRLGVSIANLACRWILDAPAVAGIIVGARLGRTGHIDDNVRLFSLALDEECRRDIREAIASLRAIPGDCGDEYRKPPFLTASGDLSHHLDAFPAPYDVIVRGNRTLALSGTVWEGLAGFSRAVREGNRIVVSGTTATHGTLAIGGADPVAQAHFVIDKLEGAIQSLGGCLEDVVRTRVYVRRTSDWEAVSRVHGERFRHVQPANTLVRADLIGDEYLVEMEAEAVLPDDGPLRSVSP
jgi:aryl-alcohol dehydrogenase-like predicted oxidoreductase/enamine deaminase RidA (YjgF/YER057c/UK114 family)